MAPMRSRPLRRKPIARAWRCRASRRRLRRGPATKPTGPRGTIRRMAGPGPTIQIPRWIQLVGLPVLLVLAFFLASTLGHVLFLFLTAGVIAFTLNPLVRA